MKNHQKPTARWMLLIGLAAVGLTAPPAFAAGDQDDGKQPSKPMQIARGAGEWADNCGRCHNLRDPKEFSAKDWDLIMSQMRVRANLPGQVARDIAAFLKASR